MLNYQLTGCVCISFSIQQVYEEDEVSTALIKAGPVRFGAWRGAEVKEIQPSNRHNIQIAQTLYCGAESAMHSDLI